MPKFLDNLALLFIGLKLAEIIDWSWWFVLSPLIVPMFAGFYVAFKRHYKKYSEQRHWRKMKEARRSGPDESQ